MPSLLNLLPISHPFPSRLLQSPSVSSLSHIANSHWLSILNMVMYVSTLLSPGLPLSPSSLRSSRVHTSAFMPSLLSFQGKQLSAQPGHCSLEGQVALKYGHETLLPGNVPPAPLESEQSPLPPASLLTSVRPWVCSLPR